VKAIELKQYEPPTIPRTHLPTSRKIYTPQQGELDRELGIEAEHGLILL